MGDEHLQFEYINKIKTMYIHKHVVVIIISVNLLPPQAEVLRCNQWYLRGRSDRESGNLGFCGAI